MPEVGETRKLSELGLVSRRAVLKGGAAVAAGAGLAATVGSKTAQAGIGRLAPANARRVGDGQFTGPEHTQAWSVPYTDLCIPVGLSDGSLLLIGGDSYNEGTPRLGKDADWRAPIGLRSHSDPLAGKVEIDGAVLDNKGVAHVSRTRRIPAGGRNSRITGGASPMASGRGGTSRPRSSTGASGARSAPPSTTSTSPSATGTRTPITARTITTTSSPIGGPA
ncbi:hypothetical protein AB0I77_02865 [Streptomyces sp. NPDC050619]|uniref:hypothetical protein n=1 Tax=Streptomyces sp. NPDC050619 TaxID=3157214 RepID=UPI00342982BE